MNILIGTGSLYQNAGGPFLSVRSTAEILAFKGHSIFVFGSKDDNTQSRNPITYKQQSNLKVEALNKYGPYSLHFTPEIGKILNKNKNIDIASFQNIWMWNCGKAARFCAKYKIPYMVAPRGVFNDVAMNISKIKKGLAKYWFVNSLLENATCFHALTIAEYKAIRSFGIKKPVAIIPNGVFYPEERNPLNNTLPPNLSGKKILLFLGRLHAIKNIESLIKAWAGVGKNRGIWHLVIAGSGDDSYTEKLKKLAESLNITEEISFPGFISEEDKPKWFGIADAFILSSLSEGMPMAVLEAMSYKIPCILTKQCNIPEAFEYKAAIQCTPEKESIQTAILNLLSKNDCQLQEMKSNAFNLIKGKYTWDAIGDELTKVYEWMLNKDLPKPDCLLLD